MMLHTSNFTLKVTTVLLLVYVIAERCAGEPVAEPANSKASHDGSRTPHEFLRAPPKRETKVQAPTRLRNVQSDAPSTVVEEKPSIVQRVARWFFAPDGPPAPVPDLQDRKPTNHGPLKPPSNQYGPPRPPKSIRHIELPPLPPSHRGNSGRYGPPRSPSHHLGPPKLPTNQGPPFTKYGPPSVQYGVPKQPGHHHSPPSDQYGPPPKPPNYIPPSGLFSVPKPPTSHGLSASVNYRPALNSHQGSSSHPVVLPHHRPGIPHHATPSSNHKGRSCNPCNKVPWIPLPDRPHSSLTATGAGPSGQYLPPAGDTLPFNKPESDYGPPPVSGLDSSGQYGPPPLSPPPDGTLNPPSIIENQYGPPQPHRPSEQYGAPHGGSPQGGLTPPKDTYGPPAATPNNMYGSPHPNLAPGDDYGPPPLPPLLQAPLNQHGHSSSGPGEGGGGLHGSPSEPVLSPSYLPLAPIDEAKAFNKPSSIPEFLIPPESAGNGENYPASHDQIHQTQHQEIHSGLPGGETIDVVKSVAVLDDSQTAAQHSVPENVNGEVIKEDSKAIYLVPDRDKWNQENGGQPANDQLQLPTGDNANHPLHSHDSSSQIPTRENLISDHKNNDNLEVIKSVQVADFLSSIEYPLQIVQSPYVDINPVSTPGPEINAVNSQQQEYNVSPQSQNELPLHPHQEDEIIIGKPIRNEDYTTRNKYNEDTQNRVRHNEKETFASPNFQDTLHHHLETSSVSHKVQESVSNVKNVSRNKNQNVDQNASSTNEETVNRPNELDVPPVSDDLNPAGNHLYPVDDNVKDSVTHENVTSSITAGVGSSSHNTQSQDKVRVLAGNTNSQTGTHESVIVDIQPSLQTSAQGASLIYQINNLNTPPPPFHHAFPSTPGQTSVFVSFQHAPPKPFNFEPALLNQQLPPPAPFQSSFHHPPPPYHSIHQAEPPVTYLNPPPEPIKDLNAVTNLPTDYSWPPPLNPATSTWGSVTASPLQTPFRHDNGAVSFANAGLLPPPPPPAAAAPISHHGQASHQNKKTKQIQIIVPYTSSKDLIQFNFPQQSQDNIETGGWSPLTNQDPIANQGRNVPKNINCSEIISDASIQSQAAWEEQVLRCNAQMNNQFPQTFEGFDDFQQHQESRRVTAKAPLKDQKTLPHTAAEENQGRPRPNFSEMQHIFATNIRELLRGEVETKPPLDSVNLLKLQKNIDEWTALEYSRSKNIPEDYTNNEDARGTTAKASAGSTLKHPLLPSKQIPEEYLTTTPLPYDDYAINENSVATAVPSVVQRNISSKSFDHTFYDHDVSGSHTHTITASIGDISVNTSESEDKYNAPSNSWKFFESNLVLPEAVTVTATPETTVEDTTEDSTEPTEPTSHISWDHLEVSISPITKEKVYVVTPLSTWTSPTTPIPPHRHVPSSPYQAISRDTMYVTTTSPSPTSINDIIPFRNSFLPPSDNRITPLTFHSPRFLIRPTPLPSLQRLFTLKTSDMLPSTRKAKTFHGSQTEDNIIQDDTYPLTEDVSSGRYVTTPLPANSTFKSRANASFFGLTDLPTYTPPNGARVETYSGHSKVVTAVTTPTVVTGRKKFSTYESKKSATSSTSTTDFPSEPVSDLRRLRPDRDSYLWNFPELVAPGDVLKEEDVDAVQGAALELQKEKRS